jgi:hypothetical protein
LFTRDISIGSSPDDHAPRIAGARPAATAEQQDAKQDQPRR